MDQVQLSDSHRNPGGEGLPELGGNDSDFTGFSSDVLGGFTAPAIGGGAYGQAENQKFDVPAVNG